MDNLTLRPLSTGEVLDLAFALYRRHFVALATISVVVQGIPILLQVYSQGLGGLTGNLTLYVLSLLVSTVGAAVGMGASMHIVADSYLGREIAARDALARAIPFIGRLILLSLAGGFLIGFGFMLLIVPGIIVACGLGVAAQALVLENLPSAGVAMNRSWNLTRGFRGKVFLTFLVAFLLVYLSAAAAGFFAGLFGGWLSGGTGYLLLMTILSAIFSILVYPYL